MTTNALSEQGRTTTRTELGDSPSRLRKAVTTVRTSRPAQVVTTHRKPVAATVLAIAGAATAALLILRKRATKPAPSWRRPFRRY
jgi:hypothetical protein